MPPPSSMKSVATFIISLLTLQFAYSDMIFDSGMSEVFAATEPGFIEINDSAGGAATTVTFNTGANVQGIDPFDDGVSVNDNSIAIFNDGNFVEDVSAYDNSMMTINGGVFSKDVYGFNDTEVLVAGGTISNDLNAQDNSVVTVTGGFQNDDIVVENMATVNFSGGTLAEDFEVSGNSNVNISGGTARDVLVSGGSVNISGGILKNSVAFGGSVNITGGNIQDAISFGGTMNIASGATIEGVLAADGGDITVTGGSLFSSLLADDIGIFAENGGMVTLIGSDFFLNDIAYAGGSLTNVMGTLRGTLEDGTMFGNVKFDTRPSACGCTAGTLRAIPEPSGFLLSSMLLAVTVIRHRRRPDKTRR